MNNLTERNERSTRYHALVLAVGLHLALGFLLYTQMSDTSPSNDTSISNVNALKETPQETAKTVSRP